MTEARKFLVKYELGAIALCLVFRYIVPTLLQDAIMVVILSFGTLVWSCIFYLFLEEVRLNKYLILFFLMLFAIVVFYIFPIGYMIFGEFWKNVYQDACGFMILLVGVIIYLFETDLEDY